MDPGVRPWVSMAEALGWPKLDCPVYVNGTGANAARRAANTPAPTVMFGQRVNKVTWECTCALDLTATNPRPNAAHRTPCQPAPTMAFGHETPRWNPRETTPDGLERFAQQSANIPDYSWPDNRPATVVAGRDLVGAPGATANRFNGSTKSRNDGVRVSIQEAGVLQSFPWDHPWQGKKSDQFLQAGNAVPPLMARAVLEEAAYGII
jgi:DNA (cytosine-5)-methyltransferase 1